MGDKGKKDKGRREQQKKAKLSPKEKRRLKKEKKRLEILVEVVGIKPRLNFFMPVFYVYKNIHLEAVGRILEP